MVSGVRSSLERGFTLIELLVVTSIMILISGMILASNSSFGGTILLQNLAYDIALSVRQAQVYGTSVARYGNNNFGASYGLHFAASSPTTYVLFADAISANGLYDSGELVQSYSIDRGYTIKKLCSPAGTSIASCTAVTTLDVIFKRPDTDAIISVRGVSCLGAPGNCAQSARVVVGSPRGDISSIVIENNGQVSVQKQ